MNIAKPLEEIKYTFIHNDLACNIFTYYLISTFVLYPRKRSYQISRCYNQNEGRIDLKMSPTSMLGMSIVFVCCICTNDGAFDLEENHNLINLINGLMKLDQMLSTREATYLVCTKTQRPLWANLIDYYYYWIHRIYY